METKALFGDLIPLSKFNDFYSFPSASALRVMLFRNQNNVASIQRKIGSRIYISISAFKEWLEIQNNNTKQLNLK